MSMTMTMPAAIDESIRAMAADAVSQAVQALAAKYGFDAEEAQRELNLGDLKLQRKRGPAPKTKAEKKTTKKADAEDKPKKKRAPTGYLLFAADIRAETREELEADIEEGEKLQPQAVVTAIAAKWKALEEEEREQWNTQAKAGAESEEE